MDSPREQLGAGWRHTSSPIGSILGPRLVDTLGATWTILPTRPAARDFHNQQTREAGKVDVMAERSPYTCYTYKIIISDKFRTRQFFFEESYQHRRRRRGKVLGGVGTARGRCWTLPERFLGANTWTRNCASGSQKCRRNFL